MLVIRWGGSPSSAFLFRSGWTGSDGPASVVNSSMQIPPPSLTALAESKSQGESLATRFVSHSTMTCSSAFGDAAMTRVEGGNFLSCMDIADFVTNWSRVYLNSSSFEEQTSQITSQTHWAPNWFLDARLHFVIATHAATVALTLQLFFSCFMNH